MPRPTAPSWSPCRRSGTCWPEARASLPAPSRSTAPRARVGRNARNPSARGEHRPAGRGEGLQHLGADRPRRHGPRRLPQDPHVRRRRRRRRLPRVRARAGGLRDRRRGGRRAAGPGHDRLLRPAFPRALPHPRRARRPPDRGALGVHLDHRPRPLGGAVAGTGDREPGLRPRPESARRAPRHFDSYGHSAIVDPWGTVLATAANRECFVAADLDLSAQEEVRESLPSLVNRRSEAYAWPQLREMHA